MLFKRNDDPARELIKLLKTAETPRPLLPRLFGRSDATGSAPRYHEGRRSDFIIAGLGIALGLTCALFPWYIFFNPDKFGVRAMKFSGGGSNQQSIPLGMGEPPQRIGAPMSAEDIPPMKLDLFATGSLRPDKDGEVGIPGVQEQPFPGPKINFNLVHVANGRAMIEDDAGLWVVQRGSVLPDSSRVVSIEQRAGNWVVVTSYDEVLKLSR